MTEISSNLSFDEEEFLLKTKAQTEKKGYTLKSESSLENNSNEFDSRSFEDEEEEEEEDSLEENENAINSKNIKETNNTMLNEQFINGTNNKKRKKNKNNIEITINNNENINTKSESNINDYKTKNDEINYNKLYSNYTPTPTPQNPKNENKNKKLKKTNKINEDFSFKEKVNYYKRLFLNENFDELEKIITLDTFDNEKIVFKFNFTFKKYLYANNKIAYIIRCIENKNLNGFSDADEEAFNGIGTLLNNQFNLIEQLRNKYEIYEKEKEEINSNIYKFYKFSEENKEFQNQLIKSKENIKKYSRVLGLLKNKGNTSFDDENSSQTSVTSFNNDLSKINRILEIRESILKNKKRLYTFNYIFIIAIIFFIGTVIFTSLFYLIFHKVYKSLLELDSFHSNFYLIEISLCQIVSTLISLKTLFELNYYKNETFNFLAFTNNETQYFTLLTEEGIKWYQNSITILNYLEINVHKFIDNPKNIFWNDTKIGDFENVLKGIDSEYYPLSISTSLASANSLLQADFFSLNYSVKTITSEQIIELNYLFFTTIENSYDYVLPNTLGLNSLFINLFKKYNNSKIKNIWIILISYMFFYFICLAIYLYLLIITNNHMGVGLEKILKISQEKINELILKIKNLKQYYDRKKEDMNKIKISDDSSDEEERYSKKSNKKILVMETSEKNPLITSNTEHSGFNLDTKRNKKLNLQNKAYIHLAIIFIFGITLIIIILIISKKVINSNNNILILQAGILGRILMATASTIYGKCELAKCNISSSLDYSSFYNEQLIFEVYQAMEGLNEIYNFYHNYFIIDICGCAYDKNDELFEICKQQELPNSLNNTADLIDYILNKVNDLISEAHYSLSIDSSYNIKNTFGSSTFSSLEESFYSYLIPVTDRINYSILKSMENMIYQKRKIIIFLIYFFNLDVLIFILYVKYGFMVTFEYLLSISKCVIKIIPSSMICSNQDLEDWLEKMNNNK